MPQVFKIGSYWVYFWANENDPLEPIHVQVHLRHVADGGIVLDHQYLWIHTHRSFPP